MSPLVRKILFLAANPNGTKNVRLDKEIREIEVNLKLCRLKDTFELVQRWAVQVKDIRQAFLDVNPHIVHFACHGAGEAGLIFEDEQGELKFINPEAFADLFNLINGKIECVVLNSCYSYEQAKAISKYISAVVGISNAIEDKDAILFSSAFYDAIGAGRGYYNAYELGCNSIELNNSVKVGLKFFGEPEDKVRNDLKHGKTINKVKENDFYKKGSENLIQSTEDRDLIKYLLKEIIYSFDENDSESNIEDINKRLEIEVETYSQLKNELLQKNIIVSEVDIARIRIEYSLLVENPKILEEFLSDPKNSKKYLRLRLNLEHLIREDNKSIVVDNCFIVYKHSKLITKYLEILWNKNFTDIVDDSEFYCTVEFKNGFIAPLYLIAGPLRRFGEDWPRINREYERSIKLENTRYQSGIIQSLLSSNFTTWIAWGPSIPICNCEQWEYSLKGIQTTLQYGFGDENNSIPLLIPDIDEEKCFDTIFNQKEYRYHEILVRRATVKAKPTILSEKTKARLAKVIHAAQTDEYQELVLKLDKISDIQVLSKPKRNAEGKVVKSIGYYTAYVWILFGVTLDNPTKFTNRFNPRYKKINNRGYLWRDLLPFFEHVNIADPLAYKIQKKLLVYKALDFIKEYSDESNLRPLQYVYLCAFDHPNCGVNELVCDSAPENETIRGILENSIKMQDKYQCLKDIIHLQNNSEYISSCHLTDLVSELNDFLMNQDVR
ncbi:hypothetical protein ACSYAD_23490 [Acaryochloris marina NIES-2412]|uniref:hypothetical protein n=1 Tax=Acaryochloris marina TaxID=155978 RepID=UPI004059E694